jgi:hypothetical protein
MLGPIGSEIMRLFRLLSPDEIEKYVSHEEVGGIQANMQMASNGESMQFDSRASKHTKKPFPKEDQAKIIPINESVENELKARAKSHVSQFGSDSKSEAEPKRLNPSTPSSGGGLESIGVLSAGRIKEIESERLKEENNSKDSATIFLLKERNKMRQSKKLLIEQSALKQYQDNAAHEFHEEVFDEESGEMASSDLKGILLNKKHY